MPLDNMKFLDLKEACLSRVFVRIQNLPWSACFQDIREFFGDLAIPKGGIMIHGGEGFVVLDYEAVPEAMLKDGCVIKGRRILLSKVRKNDLRKIISRHTRRTLNFKESNDCSVLTEVEECALRTNRCNYRKIRPTRIQGKAMEISISNSVFRPNEIDFPTNAEVSSQQESNWRKFRMRRPLDRKRKIHPTRVTDMEEWKLKCFLAPEEFGNFEVIQVKKMKLNQ